MVFYFSGTGNSQYAAEIIAESEKDKLYNIATELKANKYPEYDLAHGEKVGFVFPVYCFGMPDIVVRFIKNATFNNLNDNYFYLVLTCGGMTSGTAERFSTLCAAKGWDVRYKASLVMPDNCITLFDVENGREIEANLNRCDEQLKGICENIANCDSFDNNQSKGKLPALVTLFGHPLYGLMRTTKQFYVQSDSCVHCSICAENCPEEAITISEDGTPVWSKSRCSMCLKCLNSCPARCIQASKKTEQRGRYYNPRVLRK